MPEDLIEAYVGWYEEEPEVQAEYAAAFKRATDAGASDFESYEGWLRTWCKDEIRSDTPRDSLQIYCEWNGLIGYAGRLYEIATTEVMS